MVVKRRKVVNADARRPEGERPAWVYGIHAVAGRLATRPASLRAVYMLASGSPRRAELAQAAERAGIPVRFSDTVTLDRLTGAAAHQGVAALADPYSYADLRTTLVDQRGPVLLLDQLQDPHNLGALIRTAAAVGMAAVILPRHGAAGVSPVVEKVAAGAVGLVRICRVSNLRRCLLELCRLGYWSTGLDPRAADDIFSVDFTQRTAVVLGGETGLRPLVRQTCDSLARIPLRPGVESLNASVAGAIAMYELARQITRGQGRAPPPAG